MKICFLNGSPKPKDSTSEHLLRTLEKFLKKQETELFRISNKGELKEEEYAAVQNCDALVFAFPLYVYTAPSHVMRLLMNLEERGFQNTNIRVYCIVNCGFDEGVQNKNAVDVMRYWCDEVGLVWGQAMGIGGGEMLGNAAMKILPVGMGPKSTLKKPFETFAANILNSAGGEAMFFAPNFPQEKFYEMGTKHWYSQAKKNGLTKEDVYKGCGPDHKIY